MSNLSLAAQREALHQRSAGAPLRPLALLRRAPIGLCSSVALVAAWALASELHPVSPLFLPLPLSVVRQFAVVATDGFSNATLAQHAGISLLRVLSAFAIAAFVGIPLGLAMGINRWVSGIFD